jgi:hypothetical protein
MVSAVALSTGTATAGVPVAGQATVAFQVGGTQPAWAFLLKGALPLPQGTVGNLNITCDSPCFWLAQDETGATVGNGTCAFTTYTAPDPSKPTGTWALSCTGLSQGVATSFNVTVDAAITGSSSSRSDGGSSNIQYTGVYLAS